MSDAAEEEGARTSAPPAPAEEAPAAQPAAEEASAADAAPRPKRKKRRKRAEVLAEAPVERDENLPAFAHAWPRDPALDALVAAFEAGDYARVRRDGPALVKRTESDAVRRAARELGRRLDPDPVAVYMLMAAAALLVFLAGWYWLHPHTP